MSTDKVPVKTSVSSPIRVMADRYSIDPDKLLTILTGTVIKSTDKHKATMEEIAAFIIVANQYELNPFTREIHAFVSERGGIVPIVGIDGWVKLVNKHDDYDGCEFEEVNTPEGAPVSNTCLMYSKNRTHPVKVTEYFAECRRTSIPWNTMPHRMLRHKTYMQAARLCFGLSGIYDEDEARDILKNAQDGHQATDPLSGPPLGRVTFEQITNGHTELLGIKAPEWKSEGIAGYCLEHGDKPLMEAAQKCELPQPDKCTGEQLKILGAYLKKEPKETLFDGGQS